MDMMARVRDAQLAARKAPKSADRDVDVALLTALVGEATAVGKNAGNRETTDDEATAVVRKFLKNAEEARTLVANGKLGDDVKAKEIARIDREIHVLKSYLPAQLSEADLRASISAFVASNPGTNLGAVMKHLKDTQSGAYDGKLASAVAKSVLAGE